MLAVVVAAACMVVAVAVVVHTHNLGRVEVAG